MSTLKEEIMRSATVMLLIVYMTVACSVLSAAYLAYHGKSGWGWFLFVAILLAEVEVRQKPKDENKIAGGKDESEAK